MKQLLNTLFVTSEDVYLSLDGENVVANREGEAVARYPLHTLQSIVTFSYSGASPTLMGACAQREIGLAFCTPRGRFLARVSGPAQGNVLLRRMQYRTADDPAQSCRIARNMIFGKVYNARWSVERTRRDHGPRVDNVRFGEVSAQLQGLLPQIAAETDLDSLRGLEGSGAAAYFSVLDNMILQGKETFYFRERSRRPPLDPFNALLSFAYSLLSHDCASALESVGLDAYVGYLHRDRPGRESLALDLMEELRPCFADRFVLTLINNRVVKAADFDVRESGAVFLTDDARRTCLQRWQERKNRYPSILRRKNGLGAGAIRSESAAGSVSPGRLGGLSAFFVEVRGICWYLLPTTSIQRTLPGESVCGKLLSSASTTDSGCRTLCLNVCWTRPSAAACRTSSAKLWTRNGTACGFITWERSTRARSSTSAASRRICRRVR